MVMTEGLLRERVRPFGSVGVLPRHVGLPGPAGQGADGEGSDDRASVDDVGEAGEEGEGRGSVWGALACVC